MRPGNCHNCKEDVWTYQYCPKCKWRFCKDCRITVICPGNEWIDVCPRCHELYGVATILEWCEGELDWEEKG